MEETVRISDIAALVDEPRRLRKASDRAGSGAVVSSISWAAGGRETGIMGGHQRAALAQVTVQMPCSVEWKLRVAKVRVAGSNPVVRSTGHGSGSTACGRGIHSEPLRRAEESEVGCGDDEFRVVEPSGSREMHGVTN